MSISSSTHNEGFSARWSRRKQESENLAEKNVEDEVLSKEEIAEEKLAKLNALTDQDMPDVKTLGEDSDYAGFMSINVSEALRKVALQKLFHGKSYNLRDGLDEYDGDYTSFEKLDPSIITADMKHLMAVEAEKLLAKEEADNVEEEDVALTESLEQDDEDALIEQVAETELDSLGSIDTEIDESTKEIT